MVKENPTDRVVVQPDLQAEGEADAMRRTVRLIRERAKERLGGSPEIMAQVDQIGLAIQALVGEVPFGSTSPVRRVDWTIEPGVTIGQ